MWEKAHTPAPFGLPAHYVATLKRNAANVPRFTGPLAGNRQTLSTLTKDIFFRCLSIFGGFVSFNRVKFIFRFGPAAKSFVVF